MSSFKTGPKPGGPIPGPILGPPPSPWAGPPPELALAAAILAATAAAWAAACATAPPNPPPAPPPPPSLKPPAIFLASGSLPSSRGRFWLLLLVPLGFILAAICNQIFFSQRKPISYTIQKLSKFFLFIRTIG